MEATTVGRPKKRAHEIEMARRHILSAAARVFARQGFAQAAMQDIAAEAGYSAPSLYKYFKGKQAILDDLMVSLKEESADLFKVTFPSSLTFPQKLEMLLMTHATWVEQHREAFMFFSRREGMAMARVDCDQIQGPEVVGLFESWLREHATEEDLKGHSPDMAAWFIWGICHAFFIRWLVSEPEGGLPLPQRMARLVALFLNGLASEPT